MSVDRVGQSHIRTFAHRIFLLFSKVRSHFFVALFKSAIERTIAQLLFWKKQMCENVRKKCKFPIDTFLFFKKSTFSKCTIAQPCLLGSHTFAHHTFSLFSKVRQKSNCTNAFLKRANVKKYARKVRISNRHFFFKEIIYFERKTLYREHKMF